jgi:hypothetical protein
MLKVTAERAEGIGVELKDEVDADIAEFDKAFQGMDNDPLTRSERAILSTYLYFKIKGSLHAQSGS